MKNTQKLKIEQWFFSQIKKGKYTSFKPIPSELELIEYFSVSRMTVRSVIDKLKILGVLYSRQGSSIYVSPFYSANLSLKQEEILKIDFVEVLPTQQSITPKILETFQSDGVRDKWMGYVKIYFKDDKPLSYSISWINKTYCKDLEFKYLKNNSFINYVVDNFPNKCTRNDINTLEKISNSDMSILQLSADDKYVPTTYSGYYSTEGKLLQVRILKTIPSKFKYYSHKNKIIDW